MEGKRERRDEAAGASRAACMACDVISWSSGGIGACRRRSWRSIPRSLPQQLQSFLQLHCRESERGA